MEKEKGTKQSKKTLIFVVIAVIVVFAIFGNIGEKTPANTSTSTETEVKGSESEAAPEKDALIQELKEKYELDGGYKARTDGGAEWYIDTTASADAVDPLIWAEDYYNAYGKPGAVFNILNFTNHTTTVLRNDSSDSLMLSIEVKDGVDEKSLSQGQVFNGTVLKSYILYYDDNGALVTEELH